uniref:Ras family protein n=1 Tax=Volvariella volvacea TaxID=36659 RepID=A0A1B2U6X2_9AGAR|nr:Ras family protein [Volvariella volvacea]
MYASRVQSRRQRYGKGHAQEHGHSDRAGVWREGGVQHERTSDDGSGGSLSGTENSATIQEEREVRRFLLLGDGGVGKSTFAKRFTWGHFDHKHEPGVQDVYRKGVVMNGETVSVDFLDFHFDQEEDWPLYEEVLQRVDGYILMFSLMQRSTFESLWAFQRIIRRVKGHSQVIMVLVGNKSDLDGSSLGGLGLTANREVSSEEGVELGRLLDCQYFETSAKSGVGMKQAVGTLLRSLKEERTKKDERARLERKFRLETSRLQEDRRLEQVAECLKLEPRRNHERTEPHESGDVDEEPPLSEEFEIVDLPTKPRAYGSVNVVDLTRLERKDSEETKVEDTQLSGKLRRSKLKSRSRVEVIDIGGPEMEPIDNLGLRRAISRSLRRGASYVGRFRRILATT